MKVFKGSALAVFVVFLLISGCGGGSGGGDDDAKDSPSVYTQLDATVKSLKFYEGGRDNVPLEEREYDNFHKETTRFVFYEFNLEYPRPGKETSFSLRFACDGPEGADIPDVTADFTVQPDWTRSIHTSGYGSNIPGEWKVAGEYTVKVYDTVNNKLITTGVFTIRDDAAPPVPMVPNIIDYYPSSGPAGSYVALLFDEPALPGLAENVKAFYNDREISTAGISENSMQVIVPSDAASGNITLRAGGSTSNAVYFTVSEMRVTGLMEQTVNPSPDSQTINHNNDISVTLPPGLLDRARQLSISTVENAPPSEFEPFGVNAIDISIDGLTQLDDYIEIGVRYDPARLNPDYPAADQLIPTRWVEDEGYWFPLPCRVDEANHMVYFATDHLSLFGISVVGLATAAATVVIPSLIVSWAGEMLLNDVYTTPLGNFRFMYSRKEMDANPDFTTNWAHSSRPLRPDVAITYDPSQPKYIQDIGEVFEIALGNYRHAGFKDPINIVDVSYYTGKERVYRNPIIVKVDSWYLTYRAGGSVNFENIWKRIHLPTGELTQFQDPFGSYAVIGHELFHRMQIEYYGRSGMMRLVSPANFWWVEATAEYAGSRAAWPQKYDYHNRDIPSDFLSYPLTTTGLPAPHWGDKLYEYAASVFVRFLVEVKGINFKDLVEYVAGGEPIPRLSAFIDLRPDLLYLLDYYAQFAAWSVFSENSYLSKYPIADFTESATDIADKKDSLQIGVDDVLEIEVSGGGAGVFVDFYQLPEGTRVAGDGLPDVAARLRSGDRREFDALRSNEVLYFLAVNTGPNDSSPTVTVRVKKENGAIGDERSYTFSLKPRYTAKLWAVNSSDTVLSITPDEIPDGKADQQYSFQLAAENIPGGVTQVYFEWDFGDSGTWSKGESESIWVESGGYNQPGRATHDISYTYPSGKDQCIITVWLKNRADNQVLATATALISFYNIKIQGSRHIIYELPDGVTEVTHEFEAHFSPHGTYSFEWDFGDGQSNGFSDTDISDQVDISHTYTGLKDGDEFNPSVKLFSQDGATLLGEDAVTIYFKDPEYQCGWEVDYASLIMREGNYLSQGRFHPMIYYEDAAGIRQGMQTIWYDQAKTQLMSISCNYDSATHGLYTAWWENGNKRSEVGYNHGEFHGLYTGWYENGVKRIERTYSDGDGFYGPWRQWYESGGKMFERNYQDGHTHGLWLEWYENDNKRFERTYTNGSSTGIAYYWREDGSCSSIYDHDNRKSIPCP